MTTWKCLVVVGAGALLFSGCARNESCERGRMELDKLWDTAQAQATQARLSLADQGSSPNGPWSAIESDLDLLQSSFATEQITWDAAKKKANQLQQAMQDLGGATANNYLQSLRDSVAQAVNMQTSLEKSCR
jgi:hypothetical protein